MDKKVVLVVEDDSRLLRLIVKKLEVSGISSVSAISVKDGLELLEKNDISVIWLDHYLIGKENGLDFVATVKRDDSPWKNIPIIIVSNTATSDKVQSYMKLGVHKYYTKADTNLERVVADIEKILKSE